MAAHFKPFSLSGLAEPSVLSPELPRLPAAYVPRRRLTERLLKSDCKLKLISAAPGFGKSVLLNECARQTPADTQLLWIDCQGRPLSFDSFCQLFMHLLEPAYEGAASLETLLDQLTHFPMPLRVMLDDYPRQLDESFDEAFNQLLERSPKQVTWWVSARVQPKWNLPRFLLQGDLLEIGAQELALNPEELAQLTQKHRLDLPVTVLNELMAFSDGWLAGICLLLLNADAPSLSERIQNGTPFLSDYVQREVLSCLSFELRQALHTLVHMARFNRSLCEHLLEGGAHVLDELRARQLFIKPLDSHAEWFGIWRPLALTLPRLPGAVLAKPIHVRACQWFANHGQMREAVQYALLAGQPEVAASFIARFDQEQLLVGRSVSDFLKWRGELPDELLTSSPRLIVLQGWALIVSARLDEAKRCIEDLGRHLPQPNAARQQAVLAHWQAVVGVLKRQLGHANSNDYCLPALEHLQPKDWSQRVLCHQAIAQHALAQGQLNEAQVHINEALRLARINGSILFEGLIALDYIQWLELKGELQLALEQAEMSLMHLHKAGKDSPVLGRMLLIKGYLLACMGRENEARSVYIQGSHETEGSEDAHTIFGYLGIASLAARAGDKQRAFQHLSEAERLMQWRHVPQIRYEGLIAMISASIWLQERQGAKALEALGGVLEQYQRKSLLVPSGCYDLLYRVRRYHALAQLMLGHGEQALAELNTLLAECEQLGLRIMACEARMSVAEVLHSLGQYHAADQALRTAFNEAQSIGLLRPLLELQTNHREWLRRTLPEYRSYAAPAPSAAKTENETAHSAMGEDASPLSAREIAVLRLIAQGCSNQEIAETLFISLHTVKTHARRINTKLGVARRTQAVAKAKGLGVVF